MNKSDDDRFQTHIAEPRWQQIVSVLIVGGGIVVWLGVVIFDALTN